MQRAHSTVTAHTNYGQNHAVAPMIVPPDGGWGWVIVFTGFLTIAVTDGITFSFYLFKEPMAQDLEVEQAEVAFLSALYTGFYFIGGILACSVGNYWGFRLVLCFGGFVSAMAFGSGYLMDDMFHFLIVLGFLGGIAGGFIFVAGLLPVGYYFDKKRAIALGLVSCGSGIGAIIMPQVAMIFMTMYGWRLTYAFFGGLFVVMGCMSVLIRPLKPVMVVIRPASFTSLAPGGGWAESSLFRMPSLAVSMATSHLGRSMAGTSTFVSTTGQTNQPTISQLAQETDTISIHVAEGNEQGTMLKLQEIMQPRQIEPSASVVAPLISINENEGLVAKKRPWNAYCCDAFCCCHFHGHRLPERPLNRTDLYYTGSLTRLDEYTTKEKDVDYHMHVTKAPTYFEAMQDVTRSYTFWCSRNIMNGIKSLLDYTLLQSPSFNILALCGYATYCGYFLPFLYAKTFLESGGNGNFATSLVSVAGFGTMTGRLSSGILVVAVPRFGARTVAGFANICAGIAVIAATLYENVLFQFGCIFVFGFTAGFYSPLRSIIIVDFLGLERLTSATGMMIMFQGCGSFSGAPFAELAMNYTGDGRTPYMVCGALMIASGVVLWPMRRCQRWEKRRREIRLET